jgi:outer membrane protein insertion porin family
VRITELRHGDDTRRDVLVSVDEAPLTTIAYGGGFEVRLRVIRSAAEPDIATEKLEGAPRASFEIGRRNLFGRNRSVTLFTSASLHPRDSPVFTNQASTSGGTGSFGFPEYRVIGQFREPRILKSGADLRVTGTFEQQIRSSFNFSRRGAAAEIGGRITRSLSLTGSYQVQRTRVFDQSVEISQQNILDRIFPNVRLSSFSGAVIRDTTDDPVNATHGQYFSVNGQLAARAVGSQVGFLKSFLTAKTFYPLTDRRQLVLAASARLGMAAGFPREVVDEQNRPVLDVNGEQAIVRELPASERFYAGGDTTVRGFALDQLGVRHTPPAPNDTIDSSGFPLGGNGLVILMGELRVPLRGGLGLVGFVDTGNVFKRVVDINLGELRTAVGFGFRYKSPVGPIRFDLGFKTNRLENEGVTAWFVTFGQAF